MSNNKIVIGNAKDKDKDKEDIIKNKHSLQEDIIPDSKDSSGAIDLPTEQEPLDDNLWGSDYELNRQLEKEVLDEKRRYVRARYFQPIECKRIGYSLEAEPIELDKPIALTIFDISMGGIGVVCNELINKDTILIFDIVLDQFKYEVMCEVIYCIKTDDNYRMGLKNIKKDKAFTRHLKIIVARLSLQSKYLPKESKSN